MTKEDKIKKRNPKQIIESQKDPHLESLYVKFPGEEMREVSLERRTNEASGDETKISNIMVEDTLRRYGGKFKWHPGNRYAEIHTHPENKEMDGVYALPSYNDLVRFLINVDVKTMAIAQTDNRVGKVKGYFILKKKDVKRPKVRPPVEEIKTDIKEYEMAIGKTWSERLKYGDTPKRELKKLADKYDLIYKWVPVKEYELSDETKGSQWSFVERGKFKKRNLESTLSIILIITGLFLLSPNITGNAISFLNQPASNFLGGILFLIGITGLFIWRRSK